MQQNLQQTCSYGILLPYVPASVGVISLFDIVINGFVVNTYEWLCQFSNPAVPGSNPGGRAAFSQIRSRGHLRVLTRSRWSLVYGKIVAAVR